ncbi:MAG TPA: hypothetical protein VFF19_10735 [Reyranella sp.]|nr:hypothetical protein [Reyranella sp.]
MIGRQATQRGHHERRKGEKDSCNEAATDGGGKDKHKDSMADHGGPSD